MADELISKEVLRNTRAEVDKLVQQLSKANQERFKNDSEYAAKIFIQAYKKIAEEQLSIVKDVSLRESRDEAKRIAEEARLKRAVAVEEAKNLEEQINRVKHNKELNEKLKDSVVTLLTEERKEKTKAALEANKEINEQSSKARAYYSAELDHMTARERFNEKNKNFNKALEDSRKKIIDAEFELADAQKTHDEAAIKAAQEKYEIAKEENEELEETKKKREKTQAIVDALGKSLGQLANVVDNNLEALGGYQAGMMARLQGSQSDFDDMVSLVRRNLAGSPLVKQKDVLDNLQKLTEKGIAYDLEQRAFLATVSDKIATTFDATNGTLLRLIRVQQADTTAARLGMEANLTRMLNAMFSDTSYLSDVYDTVSDAILDANSQLSRDNSVAFEYTVQKWLGALYSLGLSQGAVSSIAQGINLLGTGNVSALAGNEQLQTLLAMSASKGGLAYADLLIDGLDSSETNKLLRGMSEYLKEIAEGADNQVVKNAFAQVFGLSVSDFAALQNLTSGEIENIYNQNMGYSGAMGELTYQLSQIGSRIPLGQRIKNVFDNVMFATASEIFESPASYVTYLITDAIEQVTGGIPLPAVYAFGTGLDLTAFTIEGIIKDAIVGINLLKNIPAIFGSMLSGGGVSLSQWGGEPGYLTRGNEFINISFGAQRSTSSGTYVGSASSTDMKSSSISSAAEEGKEFKSASGQEDVEYAKAVPALEKGGAEMWLKWLKAMTTELDENPLPVKIAGQSSPVSVQMVFGTSDGLVPNVYTMENLIKAVVDAYSDSSQAFKVESTNSFIDAVNNAYSGGV